MTPAAVRSPPWISTTISFMKMLSRESVAWNGLIPALESRLLQWNPGNLGGELKYRDNLYEHLRDSVPEGCVVQKEYRHLGTTIDIWIKWLGFLWTTEVGFELKLNLTKKSDYDRLIGQLESMEPSKTNIVVVLIGSVEEAFLMKLKHRYSTQLSDDVISKTMAVVHVPVEA